MAQNETVPTEASVEQCTAAPSPSFLACCALIATLTGTVTPACERVRTEGNPPADSTAARFPDSLPAGTSTVAETLHVHPHISSLPVPSGAGAFAVHGACPGEYCAYGEWTLAAEVWLRSAPALEADTVGMIVAQQAVCADSGLVIVNPPGLALMEQSFESTGDYGHPPFARGDTVTIFSYLGEGYWVVRWRDSMTIAYAHWDDRLNPGARVLRPVRHYWWVHLTNRATGQRGWILRTRTREPMAGNAGFEVVDGGLNDAALRITPCA